MDKSEAGHYWVMVDPEDFPRTYRNWSRMTVVGRVSNEKPVRHEHATGGEPVLAALYLRGWGSGWGGYGVAQEETWEAGQDPSYLLSAPAETSRN